MSLWMVLRKELIDTLRDRRTLWAMILGPVLVMPLFVILPQKLVERQLVEQQETVARVAVQGADEAPALIKFLEAEGPAAVVRVAEADAAVREGQADVGLQVPTGFAASLDAERPVGLYLLADQSKMASSLHAERVRVMLERYAQSVVMERLAARGIDATVLLPYTVESVNLAGEQQMDGLMLGQMLPMFIVLWALLGGMYTAIDVTAGEKERQTLEPLLTAPVSRAQIVVGKLLAVMTTSFAATGLSVASMVVASALLPTGSNGGSLALQLEPATALLVVLAALPVVLMFSALEMAVCIWARSFKEAQNYIVPLQFVVLIPAVVVMVMPELSPGVAGYAVPVFGALVVFRDLFLGQVDGLAFVVMTGSTVICAALAVGLALRQFSREEVLFRV